MMTIVRAYHSDDWDAVWRIVKPAFRAGETYSFDNDISEAEAHQIWIESPKATYVAEDTNRDLVGTYFIKQNQSGNGSHVCNCGYIVADAAQGKGVASLMCKHSQEKAKSFGFKAMQYNFVVSTNEGAVRLWQKHGFDIVGTIPDAFHHPKKGFVDVYVMHKMLD